MKFLLLPRTVPGLFVFMVFGLQIVQLLVEEASRYNEYFIGRTVHTAWQTIEEMHLFLPVIAQIGLIHRPRILQKSSQNRLSF
jgi:hypothetical protein